MYLKYMFNDRYVIEDVIFNTPNSYENIHFNFDLDTFMNLEIGVGEEGDDQIKRFIEATFYLLDGYPLFMRIMRPPGDDHNNAETFKPSLGYYKPFNNSRGAKQENREFFAQLKSVLIYVGLNYGVVKVLNFHLE